MNETPWRSLGETADDFRNADKSEGNCITCTVSDTTCVYHPAIVSCSAKRAPARSAVAEHVHASPSGLTIGRRSDPAAETKQPSAVGLSC
jgi:hypothetical protein